MAFIFSTPHIFSPAYPSTHLSAPIRGHIVPRHTTHLFSSNPAMSSSIVASRSELLEDDVMRGIDWGEWAAVMDQLYSPDPDQIDEGLATIETWRASVGVNISIDVTATLSKARAMDHRRSASLHEINSLFSMAIVRLVNGLTSELESAEKGGKNRTVRQMAADLEIPTELVDIRHAATHKALPSLPEVRIGAALALEYLFVHYWCPQKESMLRYRRKQTLAGGVKALLGGGLLTGQHPTLHPFASGGLPAPLATGSLENSSAQMILKMQAECSEGIAAKIAELEASLGITHEAKRPVAKVWRVSPEAVDTLILTKSEQNVKVDTNRVKVGVKRKREGDESK